MSIAFPNLGIYLKYVPKSFSIGGFTIACYGILIAIGVLLGFSVANKEANRQALRRDICWDFAFPAILFSILGARLYYVYFSWDYYGTHPQDIFNIRQGGLAIYGGVIAGFLTLFLFCKIKRVNFHRMADSCVLGLLVGQAIGRWGNFTNREAFGEYTESLFAMRIPAQMVRSSDISVDIARHLSGDIDYIQVHPTFLYESMLNVILFLLLYGYSKHKAYAGEIAVLYLGGYGIIRFFVEGLRTDQLLLTGTALPISQLLGISLFLIAAVTEIIIRLVLIVRKKG